jgi:hypothetical protein
MKHVFPPATAGRLFNDGWTQIDTDYVQIGWFTFCLTESYTPRLLTFLSVRIRVHPWLDIGFQNRATFPQTRFSKKGSK